MVEKTIKNSLVSLAMVAVLCLSATEVIALNISTNDSFGQFSEANKSNTVFLNINVTPEFYVMKVDERLKFAANYKDIIDRLITIAAEKYGIIYIVNVDNKNFFSSKVKSVLVS
ncbi:MAG: hypothetical protein ACI9E5_000362 [Candidatus Omnitrophota bacterium]